MVRCFNGDKIIGMVEYTDNLDHWDGSNYTSGRIGRHLGIGKTKDNRYYACYGTQWEKEQDYAEIISEKEAKSLCLRHNPDIYKELFNEPLPKL